tara:strand:+ start:165 stop:569 length:405 start_codon:yes stop_codon:yes gene_type:complete
MNILKENNFCKYTLNNNILLVEIKKEQPTDEEWINTINLMKGFYKLAEKKNFIFSIIFDVTKIGIIEYCKILEWSNLFIDYKDLTKKYIKCSTIITNSLFIKNILNIFFGIYTTVKPMKMVGNIKDAYIFINEN